MKHVKLYEQYISEECDACVKKYDTEVEDVAEVEVETDTNDVMTKSETISYIRKLKKAGNEKEANLVLRAAKIGGMEISEEDYNF